MHWFIHGSVGVLSANVWPERPLIAIAASVGSHYLLDWLPHRDPGIGTPRVKWGSPEVREFFAIALPDGMFTGMLAFVLPWMVPLMPYWLTLSCVVASIAPDLVDGIAMITGKPLLQRHLAFHNWMHYDHYRRPVPWGWNLFIHLVLFAALAIATGIITHANGVAPAP